MTNLLQAWAATELHAGELSRARALVSRALAADARHGASWCVAGLLDERAGDARGAMQRYARGLQLAPTHGPLYKAAATLAARSGDYTTARAYFTQGLEAQPYYAPLYHAAAEIEAQIGNIDALAALDQKARAYFGESGGRYPGAKRGAPMAPPPTEAEIAAARAPAPRPE